MTPQEVTATRQATRRAARKLGARCDLCPLAKEPPVPAEPHRGPLRLILVGEGPGRVEVKLSKPFVGLSGKLLDSLLARNGIRRSDCYVTNTALCRGEADRDNDRAAECCAPRLLREIAALPKEIPIVTLGKSATRAVLGVTSSFLQARGFIWDIPPTDPKKIAAQRKSAFSKQLKTKARAESDLKLDTLETRAVLSGRTVLPTVHPAFVLRSDVWHAIIRLDFARVQRILADPSKELEDRKARPVTISSAKAMAQLWQLRSQVALDVETTKAVSPLKVKLLCVGMSDGRRTFVVWPWKPMRAKPLAKFLRTRTAVVGHNLMAFDKVVLEEHGVR